MDEFRNKRSILGFDERLIECIANQSQQLEFSDAWAKILLIFVIIESNFYQMRYFIQFPLPIVNKELISTQIVC